MSQKTDVQTPPLVAEIARFIDWSFAGFQRLPIARLSTEDSGRYSVSLVRARRTGPFSDGFFSRGEVLVQMPPNPDIEKELKRLVVEKGKIIKHVAFDQNSGYFIFYFNPVPPVHRNDDTGASNLLVYPYEDTQFLFEALDAAKEVFSILSIDLSYFSHMRLHEVTSVFVPEKNSWTTLEKHLRRAKGISD